MFGRRRGAVNRVTLIQGHPDGSPERLVRALAAAYIEGARAAGREVRVLDVAAMEFPVLRSKRDFDEGAVPKAIQSAQETIHWAQHLVICYPLWLGTMPALLHAFFEQTFRPGFAANPGAQGGAWAKLLAGRSAHIVVTMGMPAPVYRWYYRAHALKGLERNILGFAGIGPIRETLFGMVDVRSEITHGKWVRQLRDMGRAGR